MVDGHEEDHDGDVDIVVVDVDPTAGEEDDVPELFQREVVSGQEDHTSGSTYSCHGCNDYTIYMLFEGLDASGDRGRSQAETEPELSAAPSQGCSRDGRTNKTSL